MALGFVEGVRIRGLIVFVVEAEIDDGLLEAIDAQARFTACDDEPIGGDAELLADGGRLLALLRLGEFVRLGEADNEVEAVLTQEVDHLKVELARVVADVNEGDNQIEAAFGVEEVADETCPAVALGLASLCEAVAG